MPACQRLAQQGDHPFEVLTFAQCGSTQGTSAGPAAKVSDSRQDLEWPAEYPASDDLPCNAQPPWEEDARTTAQLPWPGGGHSSGAPAVTPVLLQL